MDTARIRQRLEKEQQDLQAHIARLQDESRSARDAEVQDEIDLVTTDTERATSLEESSREYETLTQVEDAIQRLNAGTYGKCIDCGRTIEPARLEAVPWTPYCREDQEKHELLKQTPSE